MGGGTRSFERASFLYFFQDPVLVDMHKISRYSFPVERDFSLKNCGSRSLSSSSSSPPVPPTSVDEYRERERNSIVGLIKAKRIKKNALGKYSS